MKSQTVKRTVLSALLMSAAGFSGTSSAHEALGSLANNASAIDVYHTSCFSWAADQDFDGDGIIDEYSGPAARFVGRINKTAGNNSVKLSIAKIGVAGSGASVSDSSNNGNPSAFVARSNGNGDYVFAVSHTNANTNSYLAEIHCERSTTPAGGAAANGFGAHTGTGVGGNPPVADFTQIINQ
ncbi:MAG: hypothetical protein HOP23_02940 [Methylococcaceae bacterium]|nr:hypothetical protein [Methylococcaceae bacterium]